MTPPLGDTTPPTGPMFLCLDATPLISFNDIKQTDLLGEWLPVAFTSIAVIELELKKRARQNHPTISAPWLWSVPSHPEDTELISGSPAVPVGR